MKPTGRPRTPPLLRFIAKWEISTEHSYQGTPCWDWIACIDRKGYGSFQLPKKTAKAHRWSYEHFVGLIPEDLQIDHLCRNRRCVNPLHLEAVTSGENTRRGINVNREKKHCLNGHLFDEENTRLYKGKRNCRTCHREYMRTWEKAA